MNERAARILDAAMEEAGRVPWYDLRLHRVAERAGVTLPELLAEYRDADAIADAWFACALRAMLEAPEGALSGLSPAARAEAVLTRWFAAQAPHRRAVGGMVRAKLHLSHFHHWVPAVFHVSRLMHWALDAARLDARGSLARQAEEVGMTAAFLSALRAFPRDDEALTATRRALRRGLGFLDQLPR